MSAPTVAFCHLLASVTQQTSSDTGAWLDLATQRHHAQLTSVWNSVCFTQISQCLDLGGEDIVSKTNCSPWLPLAFRFEPVTALLSPAAFFIVHSKLNSETERVFRKARLGPTDDFRSWGPREQGLGLLWGRCCQGPSSEKLPG